MMGFDPSLDFSRCSMFPQINPNMVVLNAFDPSLDLHRLSSGSSTGPPTRTHISSRLFGPRPGGSVVFAKTAPSKTRRFVRGQLWAPKRTGWKRPEGWWKCWIGRFQHPEWKVYEDIIIIDIILDFFLDRKTTQNGPWITRCDGSILVWV